MPCVVFAFVNMIVTNIAYCPRSPSNVRCYILTIVENVLQVSQILIFSLDKITEQFAFPENF